jgi:hypothetical protein
MTPCSLEGGDQHFVGASFQSARHQGSDILQKTGTIQSLSGHNRTACFLQWMYDGKGDSHLAIRRTRKASAVLSF